MSLCFRITHFFLQLVLLLCFRVNSMISLGPLIVHYVLKILITGIKQEHQVVYHATTVRPRKKAVPNANLANQERLAMPPVPIVVIAMLVNTVKVKKTTVSTLLIQRLVLIVQRGIHQALVVPSAKSVGRGHTAMGVSLVPKVNTATAVTLLRSLAAIAQPGTTVTTSVKVHVCPAVPVNSMMLLVLILVHHV